MNWYRIAKDLGKVAQIWVYQPEEDDINEEQRTFSSKVKEMYELEYKYSMLKNNPFEGVPQRRENILRQFEKHLVKVTEEIRAQLVKTIGKWLDSHALLSVDTWSEARVREVLSGENMERGFVRMISEYYRYSGNIDSYDGNELHRILNLALRNISNYPTLREYLSNAYIPGYIEMMKDDARFSMEDFNKNNNTKFDNFEQAEQWIDDNISVDGGEIGEDIFGDISDFSMGLDNWGLGEKVLAEFYANLVFPLWSEYWYAQGIEHTRQTVQKIFDNLKNSSGENLGYFVAAVNIGLHATHQNGNMTDYLEEDTGDRNISSVLDSMTNGTFVEKADKELRSIGVQI